MKLSFSQIRSFATGAVEFYEEDGMLGFHRFTKEQRELYRVRNEAFYRKCFAPAGVKLSFTTDSRWLYLKGEAYQVLPSRHYYAIDISVNGVTVDSVASFSGMTLPADYTGIRCFFGPFEKKIPLEPGKKQVVIHLPWSAKLLLEELSLEDGSGAAPCRPEKTVLFFGDSITQGYDALHPSGRYASLLADALGAQEVNKAIGGEIFYPPLALEKDELTAAYIVVAYGTNDWSVSDRPTLLRDGRAFLEALKTNYPEAELITLLPLWRKDREKETAYGSFDLMRRDLREIGEAAGASVIDCYDFIPKDPFLYADLRLHPNDAGFACYGRCLAEAITKRETH